MEKASWFYPYCKVTEPSILDEFNKEEEIWRRDTGINTTHVIVQLPSF